MRIYYAKDYHIFYYSDDHRHGQSRRDQSAEGFVHTDDTSEAEISQPIDLSGLDSYQPVSGSVATVTNAGADEKPASQSFTISMNFVGDIMLAGNDTATSSIDAWRTASRARISSKMYGIIS